MKNNINTVKIAGVYSFFTILSLIKIISAVYSIPRIIPIIAVNTSAVLILWLGLIFLQNRSIHTIITPLIIISQLLIEVLFFLPFFYNPGPAISVFFIACILESILSVSMGALFWKRNIHISLIIASQFYIYLYFDRFQNLPLIIFICVSLILLLLYAISILLKNEMRNSDRIRKLLEEQKELNSRITANQAKIIDQEKRASLAMITAGLAHEINNPLNYIMGNFIFLKKNIEKLNNFISKGPEKTDSIFQDTNEILDDYETGLNRIKEITGGLRSIYSPTIGDISPTELNEILETVIKTLKISTSRRIRIDNEVPSGIRLNYRQTDLLSIFSNIIQNSVDSIKETGTVSISAEKAKTSITITVKDTGSGIKPEYVSRLYDPFFTTKNGNMGIGLTLVNSIIKDLGGSIDFAGGPGEGTEVTVRLPGGNNVD